MRPPRDYFNNVKDSDIISGATWRRFVAHYKEYDARQKQLITELYGQINSLSKQLEALKMHCADASKFSKKWKEHQIVCQRLHEARIEIESLQSKLATQTL